MKNFSISFAILFICFSATHIFAQKKAKFREVIVIEISVPNFENTDKREILINRTIKTKYEESGGSGQGIGFGIGYNCGDCSPESLAKMKEQALAEKKELEKKLAKKNSESPSYMFTARAFRLGKDKSNLSFEILVGENCKSRKIFKIYRNRQNKLQLKCGVSLVAYYGVESKEGN